VHFGVVPVFPGVSADLHESSILVHMRTTLNLDDELVRQAAEFTGIKEKTALIHEALRQMIQREAGRRLAALGGTMPDIQPVVRRRMGRQR
jgi:Arc/MetJ family transcription regulator